MANDFFPPLARGLKRANLKMSRLFHVSLGESLTSRWKLFQRKRTCISFWISISEMWVCQTSVIFNHNKWGKSTTSVIQLITIGSEQVYRILELISNLFSKVGCKDFPRFVWKHFAIILTIIVYLWINLCLAGRMCVVWGTKFKFAAFLSRTAWVAFIVNFYLRQLQKFSSV